jgi:hypothetical protein
MGRGVFNMGTPVEYPEGTRTEADDVAAEDGGEGEQAFEAAVGDGAGPPQRRLRLHVGAFCLVGNESRSCGGRCRRDEYYPRRF